MKPRMLTLWLALAVLAQGCASLEVRVDGYKGPLPPSASTIQQAASLLQAPLFNDGRDEYYKETIKEPLREATHKEYVKLFPKKKAARLTAEVIEAFDNSWGVVADSARVVQNAATALLEASDSAECATPNRPRIRPGQEERNFERLRIELSMAMGNFELTRASFQADLDWFDALPKVELAKIVTKGLESGSRTIVAPADARGRVVGTPLFDERITRLYEDKENWFPFSRTRFDTQGGASQFVVVREGSLVFRQKSLDFDPSQAIDAGSAVTKLGLKVAAALASGSVAIPGAAATPATPEADPTHKQIVSEAKVKSDQRLLERRQDAVRGLLSAVASTLDGVEGATGGVLDDKELERLWKELKMSLDIYKGKVAKIGGGS
jgi:hypothetical protein